MIRALALTAAVIALTASTVAAQIGNPAGMTPATPQKEPGTPAPHQPNADDRLFFDLLGSGGMAEVNGARVAQQKASNAAVKDFARRMAQDHAKANEQLGSLAKAASVKLPDTPLPDHRAAQADLDRLSGKAYDLAYMQQQLIEHQKTATLLEWEIGNGQDGDLQRYAMQQLPAIMEHLEMAQAIIGQLTGAGPQGLAASSSQAPRAARTGAGSGGSASP